MKLAQIFCKLIGHFGRFALNLPDHPDYKPVCKTTKRAFVCHLD